MPAGIVVTGVVVTTGSVVSVDSSEDSADVALASSVSSAAVLSLSSDPPLEPHAARSSEPVATMTQFRRDVMTRIYANLDTPCTEFDAIAAVVHPDGWGRCGAGS